MSDTSSGAGRSGEGILANLPRTRPQRSSARRDAARQAATVKTTPTRAPTRKRIQDPVPRQGFESEGDSISGPVQPPGGIDLLASAAELAGELTKTGLSTGGRLLKDFLTRLPLS